MSADLPDNSENIPVTGLTVMTVVCPQKLAVSASGQSSRSSSATSTSCRSSPTPDEPVPGPEVTSDPNWQSNQNSLRQRNACMMNNPLMSDVTFIAGPAGSTERFFCHKYVLSTGSSVFFAMFYGGLAESSTEIEIHDVEAAAFRILIRYLYCDEIQLDDETVLPTLYAAKKYLITPLSNACVRYLETSLNEQNACLLLSQSRLFEETSLTDRCWEVIDAQAELALASQGFTEIDSKTLRSILVRDSLNVSEISVFNALVAWATAECGRRKLPVTPENQRLVIDDIIFLMRVHADAMSLENFANGPAQSSILTLKETNDIFLNYTASTKPELQFNCNPRKGLKVMICRRFQSSAYRSNQWRYRGRCDSIQFSVNKRIFVTGFGLYGSSKGGSNYNVVMQLKKCGNILATNSTNFFSDGSSDAFPVYFKNAVQIEPDNWYTASVILEGSELSFFGQDGLSEVSVAGQVSFQFQCSSESTNGTGVQGGQIPEILFYSPSASHLLVSS